jgi:hypothetical protein
MSKKFGATGNFPMGKMNADDEGELQMGVSHDPQNSTVVLAFGKPISWIGLYPAQARQIAEALIKHAEILEKKAQ